MKPLIALGTAALLWGGIATALATSHEHKGHGAGHGAHAPAATTETAFIFNVHFTGYNVQSKKSPRRVYVDPQGEKTRSLSTPLHRLHFHGLHAQEV